MTTKPPIGETGPPKNLALRFRRDLAERCYIRKADPAVDYWFDFSAAKLEQYRTARGTDFLLVIAGAEGDGLDFYAVPFSKIAAAFTDSSLSHDREAGRRRWVGNIRDHVLKVTNATEAVDLRELHGNTEILGLPATARSAVAEATIAVEAQAATARGAFHPTDVSDGRKRAMRAIAMRLGQPAFRADLLRAYRGRCAVTGCDADAALEAAHIIPYRGDTTNHVQNGLLLRADIHTLFDRGLVGIDGASRKIVIAPSLRGTAYASLEGILLRVPVEPEDRPSAEALDDHRRDSGL